MNNHQLLTMVAALSASSAQANLPVPNHTLFGTITSFGEPVSDGTLITLRLEGANEDLVAFSTGAEPLLGMRYAIRIPMIASDVPVAGFARSGDAAVISVGGLPTAEVIIGEFGKDQELALDPAGNGSVPRLVPIPTAALEGDGSATLSLTISEEATGVVMFSWQTADGSAIGGACPGADYISASGESLIPAGDTQTQIVIGLCADDLIEGDETFNVVFSNIIGALAPASPAVVTVLDDDFDGPQLRIADLVTIEPASGQQSFSAQVELTAATASPGMLSFSTRSGSAVQDVDYVSATNAQVSYDSGVTRIDVPIAIHADGAAEDEETFEIEINSAPGLSIARDTASVIIIDSQPDENRNPLQQPQSGTDGVEGIGGVSSLLLADDGASLFASGVSDQMLARFSRSDSSGLLSFAQAVDATDAGVSSLAGVESLAISGDGAVVFAAAGADGIIQALTSDALSAGPAATSLAGVARMVRSIDGNQIYATTGSANAIAVYSINPSTGALSSLQTLTDGQNGVTGLRGAHAIAISNDDRFVYAASQPGNTITIFSRETQVGGTFGELAQVGQYQNSAIINAVSDMVISPDGQNLYAASAENGVIAIFQRAGNGQLALVDQIDGLMRPEALAISPDGIFVVVADFDADNIRIYERQSNGSLASAGVRQNGETGIANLDGPLDLLWGPNSRFLYVAASHSNAILVFHRFAGSILYRDGFE